jgi:PAS domain S-box-containing protein
LGDSSRSKRDVQGRTLSYEELDRRVQDLEKESRRLNRRNTVLEKSNEKYRAILESRAEFVRRFRPDGTLTFVNEALARRMKKRPKQLVNHNVYDDIPAADRDGVQDRLATLSPQNPVVEIDERVVALNGEVTWLRWVNTAICGDRGQVVQIEGVGRDVTEFKEVQESLEKCEQRFRYLLETMSAGFSQVDENLVLTYANLKLCEMLGYEREELLGRPAVSLLDKKNKKILVEQFRKRKEGKIGPYEIIWKKKNGKDLSVLLSATPQFDERGVFRGSHAVITDITRLKKTEQALKDREEALRRNKKELAEANVALRILLKYRDESIQDLEKKIVSNVKHMVMPYLEKLKRSVSEKEKAWIRNIESNLDGIVSPLAKKFASKPVGLTPTELEVVDLVRDGNSSKQIAGLLGISQRTVDFHRRNIRKKLGLNKAKVNLRAHLIDLR